MALKIVAVVFLACIFGANAKRLSFSNCDSSAPIRIHEVDLRSSYPIAIKPGYKISARGSYINNYKSNSETEFRIGSIKVERKILWGYTDVTSFIKSRIPKTIKCGDLETLSPIPLCPGEQGEQRFDASFTIPKTLNLGGIPSFLANGKYRVSVDVRDNNGRRVVCIKNGEAEIKL